MLYGIRDLLVLQDGREMDLTDNHGQKHLDIPLDIKVLLAILIIVSSLSHTVA